MMSLFYENGINSISWAGKIPWEYQTYLITFVKYVFLIILQNNI